MRTQVAIVGAGPAGLVLSHLLARAGIASVVLEARDRAHVEGRVRAGVLEQGTVDCLDALGLGGRMHREGLVHEGVELCFEGSTHRIDFPGLTGRRITVYGQHEVVKDLVAARLAAGGRLVFEASDVRPGGFEGERPWVTFVADGEPQRLECDFIAGCDGFHGVCRAAIPAGVLAVFERAYPFAWLGILARSRPPSPELVYARHERGFALFSMRAPDVTRLYLQCEPDTDLAQWPDERIWSELRLRLGAGGSRSLDQGEVLQRGITPMRSFVAEPMQHGRLFLAGDAAHIVPPTGAKGMNLAVADVRVLARALEAWYRDGSRARLEAYSAVCLRRVWLAERFSWWMTSLLHRFPDATPFDARLQLAELRFLAASRSASTALAENYTGLPMAWD